MSKIKFNKEWYRDNDIVINCRTEEEADKFINELAKVEITEWSSSDELKLNNRFNSYKSETCYRLEQDYTISYCSINYFRKDYTILKFSDLEFEDMLNEDDLGYEEFDNNFNKLPDIVSNSILKKPEPIIETREQHKRTILRESVELNNGDVIAVQSHLDNSESLCYGIILNNNILYNDGGFDRIDSLQDIIDEDLVMYVKAEDYIYLGGYISELLFTDELDDVLKDLIIHVQDKPKEPIKKTVEIFEVKFRKSGTITTPFISDDETIFTKNVVSPISGIYANRYGTVENIIYNKLTQEQINTYDKIIKIK